jgi:prepilin-type N-terminal cleavage/methylation domain-containing protein
MQKRTGYSFAELLIVLALLGIVSIFVVPEIVAPSFVDKSATANKNAKNVALMIEMLLKSIGILTRKMMFPQFILIR